MSSLNLLFKFNEIVWKIPKSVFTIKELRFWSSSNESKVRLMQELTGCSHKAALKSVKKKKNIDKVDEDQIKKSYSVLKDFGVPNSDIAKNLRVLLTHHITLENHYMMLEEAGFKKSKINCSTICRFYKIFKSSLLTLKIRDYIDKSTDVGAHYSAILGFSSKIQNEFTEATPLSDIHIGFIHALLTWKCGGAWDDSSSVDARLNYKSIRLIARTFDLLTNDFGLPKERVCNCSLFLILRPDNLENILKYVPTLAYTDVREVARLWPKMLYSNYKSLIQIDEYLKEFGISKETILTTPAIYTLTPENVYSRLKYTMSEPELMQWRYHPKFLTVILYHNKFVERLNRLQSANMNCMSLHLMRAPEHLFMRHVEHLDKSNQYDIITLLTMTLKADSHTIRNKLKKHPFWLYIPHKDVQETLLFLLQEGFSEEEILSSIVILLYPKNVVQDELSKLNSKSVFKSCKNPENGDLRRETVLPLLLYSIEQPYHFSKDAVWAYKNKSSEISKTTSYIFPS